MSGPDYDWCWVLLWSAGNDWQGHCVHAQQGCLGLTVADVGFSCGRQETIGKVIVCMHNKDAAGSTEEQISALVQALVPEIDDEEMVSWLGRPDVQSSSASLHPATSHW